MWNFIVMTIFLTIIFWGIDKWKAERKANEDAWRKQLLDAIADAHKKPEPKPKPYFPDDDPYWEPEGIPRTPKPSSGSGGAMVHSSDHPLAN